MSEEGEKKAEFWSMRIFRFFSRRFYGVTKTEWMTFLSEMDDQQACGSYQDSKSKRYCLLLRDRAGKRRKTERKSAEKKDISVRKAS